MFNLDRLDFDVPCPVCRFESNIFYRQARLRDVIICRGCKANIQLDDQMNQCRKARAQINAAMADLERTIASLNMKLTIRL